MTTMLSYGGGVNSTALLALCKQGKLPTPDYIVFSDTGAEMPYTYQYIDYMEKHGFHITYLTGGRTQVETLVEYCDRKRLIPSPMNRWCTTDWKRTPIDYFCRAMEIDTQWVGIDAGEEHRAKNRKGKEFPLIEMGINRRQCVEIIKDMGWCVPQKSGCFMCPYQSKRQWITLKRDFPELWEIAVRLEGNTKPDYDGNLWLFNKPWTLDEYVGDLAKQNELPGWLEDYMKCECYFD